MVAYNERITAANALEIISRYDVVADGSDNFPTRFLVNDACHFARKPLVSAAILRFDGQLATFKAFETRADTGDHGPCYRCLFREPPPPGQIPTCAEAGVLGAFCGMVGSLQATEVIKEVLGIGESMSGSLLICDALTTTFRKIKVPADPDCPLCGRRPTITDLSIHESGEPRTHHARPRQTLGNRLFRIVREGALRAGAGRVGGGHRPAHHPVLHHGGLPGAAQAGRGRRRGLAAPASRREHRRVPAKAATWTTATPPPAWPPSRNCSWRASKWACSSWSARWASAPWAWTRASLRDDVPVLEGGVVTFLNDASSDGAMLFV